MLLVPAGVLCAGGFSARLLVPGNAEVSQEIFPLDADRISPWLVEQLLGRPMMLWWDGQLLPSRRVIRQPPATNPSIELGCSRYLSC